MRNILIVSIVALLTACGSSPKDPYAERVREERQRQERMAERALDKAPEWMTVLPVSANAVYANGTAVSGDFSMADHKAKLMAYAKICMAAGGRVSQSSKIFMQDMGEASVETSETAIRSMCPNVSITGVETREIRRIAEGGRYRSYVLVALPTGDANLLQQRQDRMRLLQNSQQRSDAAFRELDKTE